MAINFPNSPSNGDIFGNFTYDTSIPGWRKTPENSASLPAGTIVQWPGATAPANWLICDGSAVSRTTYSSLFAAIGVQYGAGDGSTTFNLPNLKGRVAVGLDSTQSEFNTLGETGGAKTHTLTTSEMPSHTHTGSTTTGSSGSHTHTVTVGGGAHTHQLPMAASGAPSSVNDVPYRASGGADGNFRTGFEASGSGYGSGTGTHTHTTSVSTDGAHTHSVSFTTDSSGSGGAHNNLQPYIVLNYIIKTSAGITSGDSELATRVGAVELGKAPINNPTFTGTVTSPSINSSGSINASGAIIGTTPNDSGSTGGVAIKAPAGGSQSSAYLQFVNNAYTAQWGSIEANTSGNMVIAANQLNLPTRTYAPGHVVQVTRTRTAARSAYGYNSDAIISDLNIAITPRFASSMLMVQWAVMYESDYNSVFRVYRDGGLVYTSGYQGYNENDGNAYSGVASLQYDTDVASTPSNQLIQYFVPAGSTSATTLQLAVRSSIPTAATFYLNRSVNSGGSSAYEVGVSTAICWEIAQ